ncbi:MAG: DUF3047 domain-containing protein [Geminicoccaceae bacterium]|nr:DUF3047 domain-containing protein [Geminicoccaceae bacterium]
MRSRTCPILLLLALVAPAAAEVDAGLQRLGWRELTFDGKTPNRFAIGEGDAVEIGGQGSVSVLWRALPGDLNDLDLHWRWRVDVAPPESDLTRKGGDDRALALYVSFAFDPSGAGFVERAKRALVAPFVDQELPGRVLMYVWAGRGDTTGVWFDNPWLEGVGKYRILRGPEAELGTWYDEHVDLEADFRQAFGEPITAKTGPYQLAISADGDDTGATLRAAVADIRFGP